MRFDCCVDCKFIVALPAKLGCTFAMPNPLISLHGIGCSAVLECPKDAVPLWRYWGPRLPDKITCGQDLAASRPAPTFSLDKTVPFSLFPTFGLGWFGQSALLAHREGLDFIQGFSGCTVEWVTPGRKAVIKLSDTMANIEVCVTLSIVHDVLTISTSLTNTGVAALEVQWLAAACLPLPDNAEIVQSFSGRHNAEFVAQEDRLGRAIWRKENRRGLTSHDCFPGALVDAGDTIYGAQLAWSGNHVQTIEWLDDGRYQWQFGEWIAPGEVFLEPGASLDSPDLLATCSNKGANIIAQNFHAAIRDRVKWPGGMMQPRPVHLNSWEGYYFDHDLPSLLKLVDAAAKVGIERFVLDDGWFHRRNDDTSGLGDWHVDKIKFPGGLAPLTQHVVGKGMEFGLWIEPEMINPDSDLYRAHPEWALHTQGRPLLTARNQLVLNLTHPGVSDYLFGSISALLRDLPIGYLKWDHNRDIVTAGDRATYRQQVLAAYALFARFRDAFPHVEIEACAGGGGRIDAGIVSHSHRFWTSDCIDALSRAQIQRGFLQFMPPELMGAHIGTAPSHTTGRSQPMDFRAAIACQGHLGIELDLIKLSSAERTLLSRWIAFYKDIRHLLHDRVWTGTAADGLIWHAAGNIGEWVLFIYRTEPTGFRYMPPVRLPFAQDDAQYEISKFGPGGSGGLDGPNGAEIINGSWLKHAGLTVPPLFPEQALIFHGKII
jgi:alpha-galactosidase